MKITLAAIAAILALAGCSGDSGTERLADQVTTEPEPTVTATETEADPEPVDEPEATAEPDPRSEENNRTLPVDIEWEDSGVVLRFTSIIYGPAAVFDANGVLLEGDNTATVIVFDGSATNGTSKAISFYPYQGTLVAGSDQYEANLWEGTLGGDIYDGVTSEGTIVFESPRDPEWFDDLDEIRLLIGEAFDPDDLGSITEPIDLRIPLEQ